MLDVVETRLFQEPWDVDRRLGEMGLARAGLLRAVAASRAERLNVTDFHAANAAGTFSYHYGVAALRQKFVGGKWAVDRLNGVEAMRNEGLALRVSFQNVDVACGDLHPLPISAKGAGAERASQEGLFGGLPHYAPRSVQGFAFYYLMVAQDGAAELTRPVIKNGTFIGAIERIFLGGPDDEDLILPVDGTDDIANNFDPLIIRK